MWVRSSRSTGEQGSGPPCGEPGASGTRVTTLKAQAVAALVQACLHDNPVACLARYLVPGLPGAVKT